MWDCTVKLSRNDHFVPEGLQGLPTVVKGVFLIRLWRNEPFVTIEAIMLSPYSHPLTISMFF